MATERVRAEDLVQSDAEQAALTALREVTGEADGPMERHSMRCFLLAERMAADRGLMVDHEVLLVAGLLHDIGLYEGASAGGVYTTEGAEFAAHLLAGRPGWDERRLELCRDAIDRHHEVRSQWGDGAEVELMRRADMTELTSGVVSFGVSRGWIRGLWRAVPRDGLYPHVAQMVAKALRERPASVPKILIRGH
ncbi:MAG: HD domain-containing protein [Solirubrobacterales bacterium]